MATLVELLADNTGLSGAAVDHLQLLVADWQLLADLAFSDFLLLVPSSAEDEQPQQSRYVCVAHARPTTAPTAHPEDVVGSLLDATEHPQLNRAMTDGVICREEDPHWSHDLPMRRETIPVTVDGDVVAVLSRDTHLGTSRVPSPLEVAYLGSAADLCQMITDGTFPVFAGATDVHTSPRVGDGLIRLDSSGVVVFASPNGLSAYHRMGHRSDLVGERLAPLTRSLVRDPFDATEISDRIVGALQGRQAPRTEVDSGRSATILVRALPLRPSGRAAGALVLVRDVTEVKRRDRALLSKDATIREIHHRVKNNLQTVAALLRLQSRRTVSQQARQALGESVRRVTSIALVHEALSASVDERVDLDSLLDNVLPMVGEVATAETSTGEPRIRLSRHGTFGVVAAEIATPLVMVVAELVQNALGHAFPDGRTGTIEIEAQRSARELRVSIRDDGVGLSAEFSLEDTEGLGLQIVRTLVESELRGTLELQEREGAGTEAKLRLGLTRRE